MVELSRKLRRPLLIALTESGFRLGWNVPPGRRAF